MVMIYANSIFHSERVKMNGDSRYLPNEFVSIKQCNIQISPMRKVLFSCPFFKMRALRQSDTKRFSKAQSM